MRTAALGATCFVAVGLLSGCAGSNAVGQGKPNAPVVEVGSAEAAKKPKDKPKAASKLEAEEARVAGILGVLGGPGASLEDLLEGGSVGGVIGTTGSGFGSGGLGLSGVGLGGGGRAEGLGGFGVMGGIRGGGVGHANVGSSSDSAVKAKFGQVVVTGPLTVDVVQRFVDDHRDDVQTCHKLEQEKSSTRWGTITLLFTIDPTGHVSDVGVAESSIYSRDLESCIAHVTGSFEFPAPRTGDVTVLLPITF